MEFVLVLTKFAGFSVTDGAVTTWLPVSIPCGCIRDKLAEIRLNIPSFADWCVPYDDLEDYDA